MGNLNMAQPKSNEKKDDKCMGNESNDSTKTKTVKVASIQAPSIFKETQANIKLFTKLIKEAATNDAKFIVLPEAAITGYASQDFKHSWCIPIKSRESRLDKKKFTGHDPQQYAELKDGEMIQYFGKLCKELKIYLTVPYVEKVVCTDCTVQDKQQNTYYNSITLINPSGDIVGHYRKTNLWPYCDFPWATQGNELVCVDTEYGKVGLGICFDIHKILPGYKQLNIWTLLYCIAWVDNAQIWFSDGLPNLLERQDIPYNVIGCNWSVSKYKTTQNKNDDDDEQKNDGKVEVDYQWNGFGKTHLYGPRGKIIACTDNLYDNEIIYAHIPFGK